MGLGAVGGGMGLGGVGGGMGLGGVGGGMGEEQRQARRNRCADVLYFLIKLQTCRRSARWIYMLETDESSEFFSFFSFCLEKHERNYC